MPLEVRLPEGVVGTQLALEGVAYRVDRGVVSLNIVRVDEGFAAQNALVETRRGVVGGNGAYGRLGVNDIVFRKVRDVIIAVRLQEVWNGVLQDSGTL